MGCCLGRLARNNWAGRRKHAIEGRRMGAGGQACGSGGGSCLWRGASGAVGESREDAVQARPIFEGRSKPSGSEGREGKGPAGGRVVLQGRGRGFDPRIRQPARAAGGGVVRAASSGGVVWRGEGREQLGLGARVGVWRQGLRVHELSGLWPLGGEARAGGHSRRLRRSCSNARRRGLF